MKALLQTISIIATLGALCLGSCAGPDSQGVPFEASPEDSVKPGINKSFLDEDLDVDKFVERFEGESREVFVNREAIVKSMEIRAGADVVDVGAGTGPFIGLFANAVGPTGVVYAIDIAPNFVEHMANRALEEGHANVKAQLCSENSVDLEPGSVDYAFICDVYHHFEFPRNTMGSLHSALRKGGEVVIVDFERIPGISRDWILGHVRAGKGEVIVEMESFGFGLVEEIKILGVEENWIGRFRKQ